MKLRAIFLLAGLFVCSLQAQDLPKVLSVESYQTIIDSMVPGARFGLSIRSVRSGKELAAFNADSFFTPASTLKTLTTAAALDFFPLNYSPRTMLHLEGSISKSSFRGVLRLEGNGDPNISARYFPEPFYALRAFADSLRQKGIDTLDAKIELDTSFFSGPRKPENWRSNYYDSWYGAEVTSLIFNDNCALVRIKPGEKIGDTAIVTVEPDLGYVRIENKLITGKKRKRRYTYSLDPDSSVIRISGTIGVKAQETGVAIPVRNPNEYFKSAFLKVLADAGIFYRENPNIPRGITIRTFTVFGPPLLSLLDEINQRSQNLHAETLFRNLAAKKFHTGDVENGKKAEREFLQRLGISPDDFQVFDGSGLSPKNKVKPRAETELLAKMARHSKGKFYIRSFAGPGIGSGSKRMPNLEYAWKIRFKTGFINETHGLVGYMPTIDGDTLAIATYLNETGKIPDNTSKDALDSVWSCIFRTVNAGYGSLLEMKKLYLEGSSVAGLSKRIRHFSGKFLGRPYLLGPTGESYLEAIEPNPLVRTDSLDCVTFLEHVLALSKSPGVDSVFGTLQKIRYFGGDISYKFRKHYFVEDWLGEGTFARQILLPGDTMEIRTIPKTEFFAKKKISFGGKDPNLYLRYLPFEKALEFSKAPWSGESSVRGVGFVSRIKTIDTFHVGFLLLDKGAKPVLRDASYKFGKVLDHTLEEYLESWNGTGKVPGIILFEFL